MIMSFDFIKLPQDRTQKSRKTGLTSVIDKGLDLHSTSQWLSLAADYIDVVKLGFGTARLYPDDILQAKIKLLKDANIHVCPGGTFFEIAFAQNVVDEYFKECKRIGFNCIEISDGVIPITNADKLALIKTAKKLGFTVFSEVGRKDTVADQALSIEQRIKEINEQLAAGAWKIILEARESGNLGIYSHDTSVKTDDFNKLIQATNQEDLIFEAPHKHQQVWLIQQLGHTVNLANLAPHDVISLESLRLSLRADTINPTIEKS